MKRISFANFSTMEILQTIVQTVMTGLFVTALVLFVTIGIRNLIKLF
ncbi:gp234 [Sphingomonas phage PAU]|nr:gp234 [Sphingomonas phage PAU]AFF28232.1 gp234 [Sphingomonas phage PAU]